MYFRISSLILVISLFAYGETPSLTLEAFLGQVRQGNDLFTASEKASQAASFKKWESGFLTAPQFFTQLETGWDRKNRINPTLSGTAAQATNYSLGIQQQTSFGLQGKLSYIYNYTHVEGVSPMFLPNNSFYQGAPQIELRQSLWKNGFGGETRATQTLIESGHLATQHGERFRSRLKLVESENAYWRLSLMRQAVNVQRESLGRAQKIRDWNSKRVKNDLADRSDLLQADALLNIRKLELKAAVDDERVAARAFNAARGIHSDEVTETLQVMPTGELLASGERIERAEKRDDIVAAEYQKLAAEASAEVSRQRSLPTLDLYATASLNSLNASPGTALSDSFGTRNPFVGAGIAFTLPLDLGVKSAAREGYALDIQSAELKLKRAIFDEEQQWRDLNAGLQEAKERLQLAVDLESLQKEKIGYERERLYRGRTVTFQVLQFELDFAAAQLNRIRAEGAILGALTQLKIFGRDS